MTSRYIIALFLVAVVTQFGVGVGPSQIRAAPSEGIAPDDGIQILTRGPIHEAFAETIVYNPTPGIVVAKTPPAAIEEVPPDQRPEGANVAWIPGYWGWDDERNDFLWVSGIWRALPPGRQWIPGYWGGSGQGSQWTSGYWADAKASEVEYLSEPPATVESGPNVAAPSADDSWLPGSWVWQQSRYAWRPGYCIIFGRLVDTCSSRATGITPWIVAESCSLPSFSIRVCIRAAVSFIRQRR